MKGSFKSEVSSFRFVEWADDHRDEVSTTCVSGWVQEA